MKKIGKTHWCGLVIAIALGACSNSKEETDRSVNEAIDAKLPSAVETAVGREIDAKLPSAVETAVEKQLATKFQEMLAVLAAKKAVVEEETSEEAAHRAEAAARAAKRAPIVAKMAPAPQGMPEFPPTEFEMIPLAIPGWKEFLYEALRHYSEASQRADENEELGQRTKEHVSWAMLLSDWGWTFKEYPRICAAVKFIYRTPRLHEPVMSWALPHILQAGQLSGVSQQEQIAIMKHGEEYLRTFNYGKEKAYFEKLQADASTAREGPNPENLFVIRGPDDKADNPYRKLEAWYFRRVHFDGVRVETLREYTTRIRVSMEKAAQ